MLPSELLAVWKRKGVIAPRYAGASDENMKAATILITAYRDHIGEKKKTLRKFAGELEDAGYNYRFVRGLSVLLDRRSTFKGNDAVNPTDLRRKIFQATRKLGLATTPEKRRRIIETVGSEEKLTPEAVEEFLYADLESELMLTQFDPPSPLELLEEYNLSLTQTLLFDCTELSFTASGNWQRIFYTIKRLGLIYEASQEGGFWVKIDGPASLFKLTRRYGTALAKLLPAIIVNPQWRVEAKILWRYTNEICTFKIESWKHRAMLKKTEPPTTSYDSVAEEDFASRFQALRSYWKLKREPEPISAGKQVIIPDFSLERQGIKVYVEVVGFWTAEYLKRKVEKLKKIEAKMLVAFDENLACERLTELEKHESLNIIYYRDRIPLAPVLRYLEEEFREVQTKQTSFLDDLPITFTEPLVSFEEFASRIGVSTEAARTAITRKPPEDYIVLPNSLVRKDKLHEIGKKIEEHAGQAGRLPLSETLKLIENEGLEDATSALEALGYKIQWHGISTEKAEVIKPESE